MERALQGVPVSEITPPGGLLQSGNGDWAYEESGRSGGISNLGLDGREGGGQGAPSPVTPPAAPANEERNRILDLFRN